MKNDNYLSSLKINGFKAFTQAIDIPFTPLTVLAGANSVGKSTVIQALLLSRISLKEGEDESSRKNIPLNGRFGLMLGYASQISQQPKIEFVITFNHRETMFLNYEVPFTQNYLTLDFSSIINNSNCFTYPNFHYLCAERIGPRTFYDNEVQALPNTGYQGTDAIKLLVEGLDFDTDPDKNYHVVSKVKGESLNNLQDQTERWMQTIIPDINVSASKIQEINKSIAKYDQYTPYNVGFGISYTLPIIVSGLIAEKGSMFIIENPEAHLHPKGQSRMGQFLAMLAQAGVQVVIETHSEHIINGIRIASLQNYINTDDVTINFFSKKSDAKYIEVQTIKLDTLGNLSDFPIGFFDQVEQDLIQLTKIRRNKK